MKSVVSFLAFIAFPLSMWGAPPLPSAPADAEHPGSKIYAHGFERRDLDCQGRVVQVFLPTENRLSDTPVVVYGHGQALGLENYQATLEHLARKGVAAIFPAYDDGFFDQEWIRMGRDYVNLTSCAIDKVNAEGARLARDRVVFSGHSKGAYVAAIAAGLAVKEKLALRARAVILLETAGYDAETARFIEATTPVTVVYADRDKTVDHRLSEDFFAAVPSKRKQFIFVKSYEQQTSRRLVADHFWPLTKGSFFGGGDESSLHYFGAWKWLTAAALDLRSPAIGEHAHLYGPLAADKGVAGFSDEIRRNW